MMKMRKFIKPNQIAKLMIGCVSKETQLVGVTPTLNYGAKGVHNTEDLPGG